MWFRIHTALLHNPKAQSLTGHLFKAWINILCLAKEGDGVIPGVPQIAFHLRMKVLQAIEVMDQLEQRGFVSVQPDGTYIPNDWNEHQYKSDVSTDRVKSFRERQRNVSRNGSETPSETDTKSDTETEKELTPKPIAARSAAGEKSKLTLVKNRNADSWFDSEFWPAWPVKENKTAAKEATRKLKAEEYPVVLMGVRVQASKIAAMERPIHASTWLNKRRWEDEPASLFPIQSEPARKASTFDPYAKYDPKSPLYEPHAEN